MKRFKILYWIQSTLAILAIDLTFQFGLYFVQKLILVTILKHISNLFVKYWSIFGTKHHFYACKVLFILRSGSNWNIKYFPCFNYTIYF